MNKLYTLYMHTNMRNGKRYIGITSQSVNRRWDCGRGYRTQVFFKAIEKYGWDGFRHEIIETGLSENDAIKKETDLIKKFDTCNPKYGYNQSEVGNAPSETTKQKISKTKKMRFAMGEKSAFWGHRHTEETKALMKAHHRDCSGENNSFYGKTHTDESKEKQSLVKKEMYKDTSKHPMSKPVICVETGKRFNCASDAAKEYGLNKSGICKAIKGTYASCGGYHWRYATA